MQQSNEGRQRHSTDTTDAPHGHGVNHPDPEAQRDRIAERLREAGVSTHIFIDVHDGGKTPGGYTHAQYEPDDDRLSGNYAIYAGPGADSDVPADPDAFEGDPRDADCMWLVMADVDDYKATGSTDGLDSLPDTLVDKSPHTDGDSEGGGHRLLAVRGHVAKAMKQRFGAPNKNAPWGELQVHNRLCVGPGSQIQKGECEAEGCNRGDDCGCSKEWCDKCDDPDAGYYRIAEDRPIAVVELDTFIEAMAKDIEGPQASGSSGDTGDTEGGASRSSGRNPQDIEPGPGLPDGVDIEERLEYALERDDELRLLWNGRFGAAGYGDDRSEAEHKLATKLGWWFGQCPDTVRALMDRANTKKWCDRPDDSYRKSTLSYVGGENYYSTTGRVANVPFERIAELNDDDARQFLRGQGYTWPDTAEARKRLRDRLFHALRTREQVAIDAPTGLGKSHTVATEPWLYRTSATGDAPVIHLSPTRDARDENAAKSKEAGVNHMVLKGRKDRCPVARGDHDPEPDPDKPNPNVVLTVAGEPASEWIDRQCDEKGNPFQLAHSYVAEYNDQDATLPCCVGDTDCPATTQWDGVPRDGEGNPTADVVHATHTFAYVPSLRTNTNVFIDESPGTFTVDLTQDRIRRAVNAYLDAIEAPTTTYGGLVTLASAESSSGDIGVERDAIEAMLGDDPGREWYLNHPDAHALAPDLTRAIYQALRWEEPDENGRRSTRVLHEPPRFDDDQGQGFGGNFLSVVVDREHTVRTIRHTPDFSPARAVVGLDAHPCEPIWERTVGPKLSVESLLDRDERRLWRRFERGLTVVQVGDATRPLSGAAARKWCIEDGKLEVLLGALHDRHGDDFRTAITASRAEPVMRKRLEDIGIADPETMHYGEETSRNDFAGEPVGLVNGCIDPGDDYVLDMLAELDLDATPERSDPAALDDPRDALCAACGGRRCSECDGTGLKRAIGRGFVGPDADAAEELLASVRESHVAQAAGRYARNADDPDDTAIVYVRTDAIPDGFGDAKVNGVEWVATGTQRTIIETLASHGREGSTAKALAEDADCSPQHVRNTLNRLEDEGAVEREPGSGPNPDRWVGTMETLAETEHVELSMETAGDVIDMTDTDTESETENDTENTPDQATMPETGEDREKAQSGTYRNPIRGCLRFSGEIGRFSPTPESSRERRTKWMDATGTKVQMVADG